MPQILKPSELNFANDPNALPDFDLLTLSPRLSEVVGAKHFKFDIRKLEPGKFSFPYHFHHNAEELIMILSGSLTVRIAEKFLTAEQGQFVFFEVGENGVHQLYNHTSEDCTYLDIRTTPGIDLVEYPDSGKVNIAPYGQIYEKAEQVDYNKGEENVRQIWSKLKKGINID